MGVLINILRKISLIWMENFHIWFTMEERAPFGKQTHWISLAVDDQWMVMVMLMSTSQSSDFNCFNSWSHFSGRRLDTESLRKRRPSSFEWSHQFLTNEHDNVSDSSTNFLTPVLGKFPIWFRCNYSVKHCLGIAQVLTF